MVRDHRSAVSLDKRAAKRINTADDEVEKYKSDNRQTDLRCEQSARARYTSASDFKLQQQRRGLAGGVSAYTDARLLCYHSWKGWISEGLIVSGNHGLTVVNYEKFNSIPWKFSVFLVNTGKDVLVVLL